jgi:histidinol-phosphate phosphatase family protein
VIDARTVLLKYGARYDLHIFDADGTIRGCNVPGQHAPRGPGQWFLLPGRKEKLATLEGPIAIASNQSGIHYGQLTEEMSRGLLRAMARDALGEKRGGQARIYLCPHAKDAGCACRKPAPGMLLRAARDAGVDPGKALFVGDLDTDRQAAKAAGMPFLTAEQFFS